MPHPQLLILASQAAVKLVSNLWIITHKWITICIFSCLLMNKEVKLAYFLCTVQLPYITLTVILRTSMRADIFPELMVGVELRRGPAIHQIITKNIFFENKLFVKENTV